MTIERITLNASSLESFVNKVTESLAGRELGKIVSVSLAKQTLTVNFQKLGTSTICYDFQLLQPQKWEGRLTSEKIALGHRAFRSKIEAKLAHVLQACGAELQSTEN